MSSQDVASLQRAVAHLPRSEYTRHLRSRLTLRNYVRIADDVLHWLPTGRLLDWGAGYGQMSYLLRRRGLHVIGFDYVPSSRGVRTATLPLDGQVPLITSDDPVRLPFVEESFDGVLSCGVLEHVSDEASSLDELWRVLRPDGLLCIYQLPQEWSYLEYVVRRFELGYAHERRYTARATQQLLANHGFNVIATRRANMLPKTFTGLPAHIRTLFDLAPGAVLAADSGMARLPGINLLAGVLEIVARKQ